MNSAKVRQIGILTSTIMIALAGQSFANVEQFKLYKKAFPDVKMQCNYCHAVDKPTKDAHELNAYGLKAKELSGAEAPTQEIYQQLGRSEDFKAEDAGEVKE